MKISKEVVDAVKMRVNPDSELNENSIRTYVAAELHRELITSGREYHIAGVPVKDSQQFAKLAVMMADDLIAELNK